jgi:hypothetical protein
MFFFIYYKTPFAETALNRANYLAELGMAVIIPLLGMFLFDISTDSQAIIDYFLIVIVNIIVGGQMLASLYIFCKVVKQKLNAKKQKVKPAELHEKPMNVIVHTVEERKSIEDFSWNFHTEGKIFVSPVESINESYSRSRRHSSSILENLDLNKLFEK